MGDPSQKKTGNGVSRDAKGSVRGSLSRTADSKDQNVRLCSRIGCSGGLNSGATNSDEHKSVRPNKGTSATNSGERKSVRSTLRSFDTRKEVSGGSSSSLAAGTSPRRPLREQRKKLPSQLETDSPESSSAQDKPQVLGKSQGDLPSESRSSRSIGTSTKSVRGTSSQKSILGNSNILTGSPSSSTKRGTHVNGRKSSLRNIRCNSTSETVTKAIPSSKSNVRKRKDSVIKTVDKGGGSSLRGKKIGELSREGYNSSSSNSGVSISESRRVRQASTDRKGGTPSVRTSTLATRFQRARIGNQGSGNNSDPNYLAVTPVILQPDSSCDPNLPSSSRQFSGETSLGQSVSYSLPGSSSGRPPSPAEINSGSLLSQESLRRYNTDRIFQALLAHGFSDQDEELLYEQLFDLETNLLHNAINFSDQHREMRMDIDNMTYEELLALEEKMGNVSTALKEEQLSECLKSSTYQAKSLDNSTADLDVDEHDIKCSICQEDYIDGDELAMLQCEHGYHADCIRQWLRLKNWCPVCKASAAEPSSS